MPKYESPLGDKQFAGSSLKEYDIPDEEHYREQVIQPPARPRGAPQLDESMIRDFQNKFREQNPEDFEREIRAAREAKRTGKERLNEGAKKRIEMLVGMTRTTREFDIDGNIYILQTLRSKDMREAITAASVFDGTIGSSWEIRRQLLSRSIIQIAGVDFDQFVGSSNLEDKLDCIDSLHEALLNRIYTEYNLMVKEASDKYSIKTAEIAKEVVDDLKK